MQLDKLIKYGLFLTVLGLMSIPALQQRFKWFEEAPLSGAIREVQAPPFEFSDWWKGAYQDSLQVYLKESVGFRNSFVRIHNQIHFSFYDQAIANSVIIGKENYLYEENYILTYLGRDFIGTEAIHEKVEKIKSISDTLQQINKEIIILLAPGKGSFYPEFIPDDYEPDLKTQTNYETYASAFNSTKIHVLDFNQWFRDKKSTSPYPLFPKTGIHWSRYGEILVADSLINYIEFISKKELPNLVIDTIIKSYDMEETDDDIEDGMNLYFNIPDLEMGYPRFHIDSSGNESGLTVLTIADSYYWGLFGWGLSRDYFNNGKFWYYNEAIYPDNDGGPTKVQDIDLLSEIEKNDIILIICTDANLNRFAFGFIDQLYDAYYPKM